MKIKTSDLTLLALDWVVAECEKMDIEIRPAGACGRPLYVLAAEAGRTPWTWTPTTSWHQGGPIIEREKICLNCGDGTWGVAEGVWEAHMPYGMSDDFSEGPTPLIAAMRCYVASVLGDEVDIPEELL
jgi:hypothetical protein